MCSEAATSSVMPARCAARKHSAVNASMPLIMTLRIIFSAAAAPTSSRRDGAAHLQLVDQQRHHGLRMRTREQERGLVALRMDRRQDRDIDIARGAFEQARGFLLAAGRDRIDVEIVGIAGDVRRDRLRRLEARCGGHGRNDDVGVGDRIGGRGRKPRADPLARLLQSRAFVARKQNVPGRDALDAGFTQARGDRLAGFAETDEAEAGLVARRLGHGFSLRCTRWSKRSTLTTTRVWRPSPTRSLSSNASTRNSTVRPSTRVTTAVARNPIPTGVAA